MVDSKESSQRWWRAILERVTSVDARPVLWALLTVVVFALLFAVMLWLTSPKINSNRENGLYQFIFLAVGVAGSFLFGRQSARATAADILRPVAKAAIRRLVNLADGLQSLGGRAVAHRSKAESPRS